MEEEKVVKKGNNKSLLIIAVAIILIVIGVVLIVTGNNKSFIANDKKEDKQEQENTDNPTRHIVKGLTNEEAERIIIEKKDTEYAEELWTIGSAVVVAYNDNNEYLVKYSEIDSEFFARELMTIIQVIDGKSEVEQLPGWVEGEKDLTSYNFVFYEDNTNEEPVVEEPVVEEPQLDVPAIDETNENPPSIETPAMDNQIVETPENVEPTEPEKTE